MSLGVFRGFQFSPRRSHFKLSYQKVMVRCKGICDPELAPEEAYPPEGVGLTQTQLLGRIFQQLQAWDVCLAASALQPEKTLGKSRGQW